MSRPPFWRSSRLERSEHNPSGRHMNVWHKFNLAVVSRPPFFWTYFNCSRLEPLLFVGYKTRLEPSPCGYFDRAQSNFWWWVSGICWYVGPNNVKSFKIVFFVCIFACKIRSFAVGILFLLLFGRTHKISRYCYRNACDQYWTNVIGHTGN